MFNSFNLYQDPISDMTYNVLQRYDGGRPVPALQAAGGGGHQGADAEAEA